MVVANTPQSHADVPEPSTLIFEEVERRRPRRGPHHRLGEGAGAALRQGHPLGPLLRAAAQAPGGRAEAIQDTRRRSARSTHKLKVGGNDKLELYDYPGGTPSASTASTAAAASRPAELQKIFEDNERTAGIRMQEEAAARPGHPAATSNCRQLVAGHKFTLERHFDADGEYVLTRRRAHGQHRRATTARGGGDEFDYANTFTCIPAALPFRPAADTPRPVVQGTQTAVVVGPAGRGDLHRQVRPGEGAVPLGPRGQERRRQLLLGPRRHALGRQAVGR